MSINSYQEQATKELTDFLDATIKKSMSLKKDDIKKLDDLINNTLSAHIKKEGITSDINEQVEIYLTDLENEVFTEVHKYNILLGVFRIILETLNEHPEYKRSYSPFDNSPEYHKSIV